MDITWLILLFLYLIGYWLRINKWNMQSPMILCISVYAISTILLVCIFVFFFGLMHKESNTINTMRIMGYNNPLVILSSMAVFILFLELRFKVTGLIQWHLLYWEFL